LHILPAASADPANPVLVSSSSSVPILASCNLLLPPKKKTAISSRGLNGRKEKRTNFMQELRCCERSPPSLG
jgi:hypothetical protein